MTEFQPDPTMKHAPEPDMELVARARNMRLAEETPHETWIRQQWEVAMAGTRVALKAWRTVWPEEAADHFTEEEYAIVRAIEDDLSHAQHSLSQLAEGVLGQPYYLAMVGALDELTLKAIERDLDDDAQQD